MVNAQDNGNPLQDWLDKHSFAIIPTVQIEIDFFRELGTFFSMYCLQCWAVDDDNDLQIQLKIKNQFKIKT